MQGSAGSFVALHKYATDGSWSDDHAIGLLTSSKYAKVPMPPPWLLDESADFGVFVRDAAARDDGAIELIAPAKVVVLSLTTDERDTTGRAVVGFVELAHPSLLPTFTITRGMKRDIDDAIQENEGDYWDALRQAGVIGADIGALVPPDALSGFPPAEGRPGPVPRHDKPHASLADLASSDCRSCPVVQSCCPKLFASV